MFHPGEDLLRESLDLYHDFVGFPVVSSFLCIFLEPFWLFLFEQVNVLGMLFWGFFLFFGRVHFIPFSFHTFVSLYCLCAYFTCELYRSLAYL